MEKMQTYKSEDDLQKTVARYLDSIKGKHKFKWCHVPNGGARNVVVASKLKAQGVKPGVPDVMIFKNNNEFHGLAIELKIHYKSGKKNYPSKEQKEWIKYLREEGWAVFVAYTLDEVMVIVDEYMSNMG